MAGQELSGAGREIQQAGDIVSQTNDRQDAIVAQSAANSLRQAAIGLQYDPNNGFANVKEGGAVGQQFVDTYTQKINDAAQAIRGNLTTPQQQQIFDQHAGVVGLQYKQALLEHQAKQTDAFNDTTDNDTVQLALRSAAARPMDDLSFQTSLAQINGTIDSMGKRKGLPQQAVDSLKGQYFDAAYNTRIMAVMNGVPGVVQSNPYLAEKMFEQVQQNLGPASQVQLGHEVQKSVQLVQQRDLAQGIVNGRTPTTPATLAPAVGDSAPLLGVVKGMESNGQRYASDGSLLTSPKGAMGEMQVEGSTAANPGYGVTPAALGPDGKPSADELARVGRDYLGAMTARYQDPALVLAAYNAGPGKVDQWIAKYGDPRTGQISSADWAAKIPFNETQQYVTTGLSKLGAAAPAQSSNPAQSVGTTGADGSLPPVAAQAQPQRPTANDLKTQLPAMMAQARDAWTAMYPNDPVGADGAATRVASYGQLTIAAQQAQQDAARDTLIRGIVGAAPDGSQRAQTMDALLADPVTKAAWSAATPETQMSIQERMRVGGDPARTNDTQALVYQLQGMYSNDKQSFANLDLTPLIAKLPYADFDKLSGLQIAARNKQDLDADKAINLQHAMGIAELSALRAAGIFIPDKSTPANKRAAYDQFTGQFAQELDDFKAKNGKPPTDSDIAQMAKGLTTLVSSPGNWFGTNTAPAFATPLDAKVIVPDDFRAGITKAIQAQGKTATEPAIQTAYLLSLRTAPGRAGAPAAASPAVTAPIAAPAAPATAPVAPPAAAAPIPPPQPVAPAPAPEAPAPAPEAPAAAFARSRARMDAINAERERAAAAPPPDSGYVDVPADVGASTRRVKKS